MSLSFNGVAKVITLSVGTTTLGVRELWSRWVDWVVTSDNSKYLPAFAQVGGNDIDVLTGTSIPIYLFMLNGWKIRPQESNHTLTVYDGVLVVDGGGDPFVETLGAYTVRVNYSQPVQAITVATGGGAPIDVPAVASAVWQKLLTSGQIPGSAGAMLQETATRTAAGL